MVEESRLDPAPEADTFVVNPPPDYASVEATPVRREIFSEVTNIGPEGDADSLKQTVESKGTAKSVGHVVVQTFVNERSDSHFVVEMEAVDSLPKEVYSISFGGKAPEEASADKPAVRYMNVNDLGGRLAHWSDGVNMFTIQSSGMDGDSFRLLVESVRPIQRGES